MNTNTIINPRLKSIAEFLDGSHHFIIPSYQRGYRWEERQIIDLLNDIYEFQEDIKKKTDNKIGEFYCLQPIVVLKKADNKWEVIDGQQRLTTILILLSSLRDALRLLKLPTSLFTLEYETREKEEFSSKEFLENITSVTSIDKTNIDFYRMSDAFLIIKKWLENDDLNIGEFCNTLLKTDFEDLFDRANNIRFIWYEIDPDGDAPNIAFAKYNQGKIDLTNGELIKAIFYLSDQSMNDREKKKYQLKIGYEWDDMENTLRKKDFWRFINPTKFYTNHIEFIFELVADKYTDKTDLNLNKNIDKLWSFYVFNELITKNIVIYDERYSNTRDFLWDEIKTYYRTFVEWFNDNCYFHLIGFLIQTGRNVEVIKNLTESHTKSEMEKQLQLLIQNHFNEIDLEQIGYDDNPKKAKELLLLFNVISTMKSGYNRFSFYLFSKGKWSLEHIHAQQSEELKSEKQKRYLLAEQKQYFLTHKKLDFASKIEELLVMTKINQERFDLLQIEIFSVYSDTTTIHSIKNLALLTVPDNSCLNNNIFPIKRDLIKNLDERGSFIPICTKNVFLKYYSAGVEQNVKWDKQDMEAYISEIKNVLSNYIKIKENDYEGI
ncbi:DUF262 domain-containing protein [Flavobacterium sp. B183]|uniref:DUF262 domain-containing protein n=1 Tax=Flavobacterium sp. B183 TaxID=907046 RepID=UPI00201F3FE9|nr:DUF262 domain-containing protein [Flavobacterium sp. B183]URC14828.1 DUF262 domain-containing protein [Flavobacterium sp. B183]